MLHVGNLRTALVAWLMARSSGRDLSCIEDLDATRVAAALRSRRASSTIWPSPTADGEVCPSVRLGSPLRRALSALETYECHGTRREIAEAASALHDDGYRPHPARVATWSDADVRLGVWGASTALQEIPVTVDCRRRGTAG